MIIKVFEIVLERVNIVVCDFGVCFGFSKFFGSMGYFLGMVVC